MATATESTAESGAATLTADDAGAGKADGASAQDKGGDKSSKKRYEQIEVDRIMNEVRSTERQKYEEQMKAAEKAAETARLAEQGKWQEIAEKEKAEKEALLAEKRLTEFRESARVTLRENGLTEFDEILLAPGLHYANTSEFGKVAASLKARFDETVNAVIAKKLNTDDLPAGGVVKAKSPVDMTPEEWKAEKKRRGIY